MPFPAPGPDLGIGDLVARKYRLDEKLGEGGMATVFRATNVTLGTPVAVKVLRPHNAQDPRTLARFRQEAQVTASITHENVVRVFDYGVTPSGAPYIVMELLRGETLHARLAERGSLPPIEAVRLVMRAMKGVIVAHEKGILHRDLKPENVFLAQGDHRGERPTVLDFGVSFLAHGNGPPITRMTKTGSVIGTAAYLPPESIKTTSAKVDGRVDVWALGVVLYESMTGAVPFAEKSYHQLLQAIVADRPAPSLLGRVPGVDEDLDRIVARALAKDPARRTPSVRALFDELGGWLERHGGDGSLSLRAATRDPLDDEGPTIVAPPPKHVAALVAKAKGERAAPTRSRAAPIAAAAGFVMGAGLATLLFFPRGSVAVTIGHLPPNATVRLNGEAATVPLLAPRGKPASIHVEGPGISPWDVTLIPDGDVSIDLPTGRPAASP